MSIKLILIDYFGVISGSGWEMTNKYSSAVREELAQSAKEVNAGEICWSEFKKRISKQSGLPIQEIEKTYARHNLNTNLLEYVADLHKKYSTAVLSNANAEYLRPIFEQSGLSSIFDQIIVSSEVGALKPSPQIYNAALMAFNVAPNEAVMIDDQQDNVDGADRCGLNGVLYKDMEQLRTELSKIGIA